MAQPLSNLNPDFDYNPDIQLEQSAYSSASGSIQSIHVGPDKRLINSSIGAKITVQAGQQVELERRVLPPYSVPEPFQGTLLDRNRELSLAAKALEAKQSVELHGPPGSGKTMLLHYLADKVANRQSAEFPDGVVSLSARQLSLEDLQQQLFDAFYRSTPPLKTSLADLQEHLHSTTALIILDDVALPQNELETLIGSMPSAIFLITSTEQHSLTNWVPVSALPLEDSMRLAEEAMARPFNPEERPAVQTICNLLRNQPLSILQVISYAREKGLSLVSLAQRIREDPSTEAVTALLLSSLANDDEQAVLGILAVLDGASLTADHLADLTGISNIHSVLTALTDQYLIGEENQRFRPLGNLQDTLGQSLDLTPWTQQTLSYYLTWVERHHNQPELILAEIAPIMQVMQQAIQNERATQVLRLARPVENALFWGRQWGKWEHVLKWVVGAARRQDDQATEGWALHQLGTRALCLGEESRARNNLQEALRLHASLENQVSIDITRHNLDIIGGDARILADIPLGGGGGGIGGPPPRDPRVMYDQQVATEAPPATSISLNSILLSLLLLALITLAAFGFSRFSLGERLTTFVAANTVEVGNTGDFQAQLSANRLSFDNLALGDVSNARTLMVTNREQAAQLIPQDSIAIVGQNADAFKIASTDCYQRELKENDSCAVNVVFSATEVGYQQAVLRLGSPDKIVELSGVQNMLLGFTPERVDFGRNPVNVKTIPQVVKVTNVSDIEVAIKGVALSGGGADGFLITADECLWQHLQPGQSCEVYVAFKPIAAIDYEAFLDILSDRSNTPRQIPLTGTAKPTPTPVPPTPTPPVTCPPMPTPPRCFVDQYGQLCCNPYGSRW